tara:strand:- start:195 stop:548 length:354 start_codon:yes stop_codon:yes gene_type:complete
MNSNFIFVFLFVFLAILVTMYYFKLNSSLTCLLTIIIILLLHKVIVQKEYYSDNKKEVMVNIIRHFIDNLEVKTTPSTEIVTNENQTTISQSFLPEEEKKSFLEILKEILDDLNKQN